MKRTFIITRTTFQDCGVHFTLFSDNLSRNSCLYVVVKSGHVSSARLPEIKNKWKTQTTGVRKRSMWLSRGFNNTSFTGKFWCFGKVIFYRERWSLKRAGLTGCLDCIQQSQFSTQRFLSRSLYFWCEFITSPNKPHNSWPDPYAHFALARERKRIASGWAVS